MEDTLENFTELKTYLEDQLPAVERALREHMPLAPAQIETQFNEALEYALFPGGKRIRPVLTLLGAELVGGSPADVLPAAVAVEFVHTSSLIFDDLPCMDNATQRREKASLHEKFGEGLAVLVGLGLLNAAYSLVFVNHSAAPERAIQAHGEIVECIGASGMVGGQAVDLALVAGVPVDDSSVLEVESARNLKTSALMRLALRTGAILSGADYMELAALSRFAELMGDAYQLGDDIMDLDEDTELFENDSATMVNDIGSSAAQIRLEALIDSAKRILVSEFESGNARSCLIQLTDFIAERQA